MKSKTFTLDDRNFEMLEFFKFYQRHTNDSQAIRILLSMGFGKFCDNMTALGFDVKYDKGYKRYEIRKISKKGKDKGTN